MDRHGRIVLGAKGRNKRLKKAQEYVARAKMSKGGQKSGHANEKTNASWRPLRQAIQRREGPKQTNHAKKGKKHEKAESWWEGEGGRGDGPRGVPENAKRPEAWAITRKTSRKGKKHGKHNVRKRLSRNHPMSGREGGIIIVMPTQPQRKT